MAMLTPFGKEVRKQRIDRGLTLKNMADALDVSSAYLSAVETGQKNVSKTLVDGVAKYLKLGSEEAKQLRHAAELSANDVKVNMKNKSEKEREVATVFARQFPELNDDDLDELLHVLKKRQRGD